MSDETHVALLQRQVDYYITQLTALRQQVQALTKERDQARQALQALGPADCWCEMRIGNPMIREHSPACQQARAALALDQERRSS